MKPRKILDPMERPSIASAIALIFALGFLGVAIGNALAATIGG